MREGRFILWAAIGLAIAGAAARIWNIFGEPLWLDEAYSAYAAGKSLAFLWQVVPRYETHPPFYYGLLWGWTRLFGDSLIALRSLGLIAGLLTPPALTWAGLACARWLDWPVVLRRRLALAVFALASLSIPLVEMAREVRPYPLMILLYAVAARAIVALAERSRWKAPLIGRAYGAYLLIVEALLWLHNLGPLWAAALGLALFVAVIRRGLPARDWAVLIGGHLLLLIGYAPAFLILLDQAPTWIRSTWLTFGWGVASHLLVLYAVPGWQAVAALALAVLGGLALWKAPGGRRLLAVLLILALLPVALSLTISATIAPVFITRTMTLVAVPTILLLAIGAAAWRRPVAWVSIGAMALLCANIAAVDLQARQGGPMQDWYGTLSWLKKRFRPGDQIYAYPNEGALPLRYALRDEGLNWPVRPIPADMPALDAPGGWHPTGSRGVVSLPRASLRAIAQEPGTQAIPTIWLLRLGAETYDPGDVFLEELGHGRHQVRKWTDGPIEIIGLAQGAGRIPALRSPPKPDPYRR